MQLESACARPFVLLKLAGVDSLDHAETLREMTVAVEESALTSPERWGVLLLPSRRTSCANNHRTEIGEICQVFFSGGHDIWVVRQGEKEYLIPVTEEIVRVIDIPGRQAIIEPLAGLLD